MSFVIPSWYLSIFFFAVCILFLYLSSRWPRTKKGGMIQGKEILFIIGISYLILTHFAMYVSIGQALDENYQAPCENVVNSSNYVNTSFTTYTYVDSCATRTTPESSSALVVIFTWLFFLGGLGVFFTIIYYMVTFFKRFV